MFKDCTEVHVFSAPLCTSSRPSNTEITKLTETITLQQPYGTRRQPHGDIPPDIRLPLLVGYGYIVGRLGSGVQASASFQIFSRGGGIVGGLTPVGGYLYTLHNGSFTVT